MTDVYFFFFSSRRRHTRWNCDWSSDVCSSDLPHAFPECVCTPKRTSILRQIGPSWYPRFPRRVGGLGGARAGLPSVPLRELLRPLGRPGHVLLPSFPPSPGLQHLGVSHVSQMSQDGPPVVARLEWGDSLTRLGDLGYVIAPLFPSPSSTRAR